MNTPPPMIIVSTAEGNQRVSNTWFSSCSRHRPNKNQELTLSTKPVTLHAVSSVMLSRDQKEDPHREPPSLSLHPAGILSTDQKGDLNREPLSLSSHPTGIVSPDRRVAAVLQHRLRPTMSRGCWWCGCCCYCCCYCSGPPVETLYRDQRGRWTPPSRRRFC